MQRPSRAGGLHGRDNGTLLASLFDFLVRAAQLRREQASADRAPGSA